MKIKIERGKLSQILAGLSAIMNAMGILYPIRFQYFLTRNLALIGSAHREYSKMTMNQLGLYDKERVKMLNENCIKDEKGEPKVLENGDYDFTPENKVVVETKIKELKEKFKADFEAVEKIRKEIIEVEVHGIPWEKVMEQQIPNGAFEAIECLIEGVPA